MMKRVPFTALAAIVMLMGAPTKMLGEANGCVLVSDNRNPSEKILRCGSGLSIRNAPGTRYRLPDQAGQRQPTEVQLDSGALMLEFTPSKNRRTFQILTPHAIAAVRGTRWAVEVTSDRTSTLVISGKVEVARRSGRRRALLHAGEGADVTAGAGPIVVKRWAKERVDALLARFGE